MTKAILNPSEWFKSLPYLIKSLYSKEFKNTDTILLDKTLNELVVISFELWSHEDEARRTDTSDKNIADIKRNIDKRNQKRHNLIDSIDMLLQKEIEKKVTLVDESIPLNSETPGSIFDRLIVLALRSYHLEKETKRKDADASHIKRCYFMLKEVAERSEDLLKCLKDLLLDYYSGRKRLKSYKEHKLYNDPSLNPSLRK